MSFRNLYLSGIVVLMMVASAARAEFNTFTPSYDMTPSIQNMMNPNNVYYGSNYSSQPSDTSSEKSPPAMPPFKILPSKGQDTAVLRFVLEDLEVKEAAQFGKGAVRLKSAIDDRLKRTSFGSKLTENQLRRIRNLEISGNRLLKIIEEVSNEVPVDARVRELVRKYDARASQFSERLSPGNRAALAAFWTSRALQLDNGPKRKDRQQFEEQRVQDDIRTIEDLLPKPAVAGSRMATH